MTIGDRFTKSLEERGLKQAALAAQFRERVAARGKDFVQGTVESHISRLRKSEPVAVRFFFSDVMDARDLLDALSVPEEERDRFLRDANDLLRPEDRPVRFVVDLSDSVPGRALLDVCEELANTVILATPERVALVVTEAQREYLPPRYIPAGRVRVEVVSNADTGWESVQRLAAEGAVVVSQRRFDPFARWLAFMLIEGQIKLEPEDGIARCVSGRPLDDVVEDAPSRQLDLLIGEVDASEPPSELVAKPCALRSLLAKLSSGRPVMVRTDYAGGRWRETPASERDCAAWARALNISAVATEEQWGSALLSRARGENPPVAVSGTERDLISHRVQVARGGSAPRVVLVQSTLHVINATEALRQRLEGIQGVQFHDEVKRESGFRRIEALVATTPWEAWLDDPYMDAAIARIDPDGADRDELEFARASLLLHGKLNPAPAPRLRKWFTVLREMLRSDPPAVGVRVPETSPIPSGIYADRSGLDTYLPEDEVARRKAARGVELHGIPAIVPPRVLRDSRLLILSRQRGEDDDNDGFAPRDGRDGARRFLLPEASSMNDPERLLTLFDASPARAGDSGDLTRWRAQNSGTFLAHLSWNAQPVVTHERFWRDADEALAALWIALRRAVRNAGAATLHDGRGMLEMGGGLVALVEATKTGSASGGVEADFWRVPLRGNPRQEARPTASILQEIVTRTARTDRYETRVTTEVPTRLFLAGRGARLSITFTATPWETALDGAAARVIDASVAGATQAEDEARAIDDNFDDDD